MLADEADAVKILFAAECAWDETDLLLWEYFDEQPARPPIQIFATDLRDPATLEKARSGVYPENIEVQVSPERLRRFFHREDHVYRIDKSIRDACVFARQNVVADPPFSHVDLISCRNVMIYMSTTLQRRVVQTFHYALNMPGFLVLGSAESVGEHSELFEVVDRTHRIYSKKAAASRILKHFSIDDPRVVFAATGRRPELPNARHTDFQREADRIALGRYAPPGVLLSSSFDVIQFRGRTGPYLEAPAGEPTVNVLKMAREGLFLDLRSALNGAKSRNSPVRRDGIRVRSEGEIREIGVEVLPVRVAGSEETCYLVLFQEPGEEVGRRPRSETEPREGLSPADAQERADGSARPADVEAESTRLRQELTAMKEYLNSLVEQQDAANEELRSANEEILSSNEELQSTNEELETAKEELQSTNEELNTVNEQLQHRNLELNQLMNDLNNLLASTTIPVVMVGRDLRIRRLTGPARRVLNLLPTDIGRAIGDIKTNIDVVDLEAVVTEVIQHVQVREREVRDREGAWYLLRVHPYRTADTMIDGAVIVLLDIDQLKRTEEVMLRQSETLRQQAALIELSNDAVIVRDEHDRIHLWNHGAEKIYGYPGTKARGMGTHALLKTKGSLSQAEMEAYLDREGQWEGELVQTRRTGARLWSTAGALSCAIRKGAGPRSSRSTATSP